MSFEIFRKHRSMLSGQIDIFERIVIPSLKDGDKFLEVGCGDGFWLSYIKNPKIKKFGLDISKEMVKKASPFAKVVVGNALHLPFSSKSFDVVFLNSVLEYCGDYEKPVKEISRVLKDGGKAIIEAPNPKVKFFGRILRGKTSRFGEYEYPWEIRKKQFEYPPLKVAKLLKKNKLIPNGVYGCNLMGIPTLFKFNITLFNKITKIFPLMGSYIYLNCVKK